MKNIFKLIILLAAVYAVGCDKDTFDDLPIEDIGGAFQDTLDENTADRLDSLIRTLPFYPFPSEVDPPEATGDPIETEEDTLGCVTTPYTWSPGFTDVLVYGQEMQAGQLYDLPSIMDGGIRIISAQREPLRLSLSLVNLPGTITHTVENPNISSLREAHQVMITSLGEGATPAHQFFDKEVVYGYDHLRVALKGGYNGLFSKVSAGFDFNNTNVRTRIIYRVYQVYYTVDADIPNRPSDLFSSDNEYRDLAEKLGVYSPVYVSKVTYGRMAVFVVESQYKASEVVAALNASFNAFIASGNIEIDTDYKKVINESNVKVMIVGGNGGDGLKTINSISSIEEYLVGGGNFSATESPGAPLAYSMRFLKDNSIARVVMASEYNARQCEVIPTESWTYEANPLDAYEFCPEVTQGDDQWGGDGPEVEGSVELFVKNDREIWARVRFLFREWEGPNQYGDSQGVINQDIRVATLPPDKVFVDFISDTYSSTHHIDDDYYSNVTPVSGGDLVREFEINGDTDSVDMDCNNSVHSFVRFYLNDIVVSVRDK